MLHPDLELISGDDSSLGATNACLKMTLTCWSDVAEP
jgi:hypothetical protein